MSTWSSCNILFILSLPRSGSTLAQRILAAHPQVVTTSESWVLLPQIYAFRKEGVFAEYGHCSLAVALEEFCNELPGGRETYLEEIRNAIVAVFGRFSRDDTSYFLEKTPRNALIARELIELFPKSKFILLWRNPAAVAASLVDTFGRGNWQLYDYKQDLFAGLENLVDIQGNYADRLCVVHYERMVMEPEAVWRHVFEFLGLEFREQMLQEFHNVELKGRMGDRVGNDSYQTLSMEPIMKWRFTMANPLRRYWLRRYLQWIGADRLSLMGYNLDVLLDELAATPGSTRGLISDLPRMIYGAMNGLFELRIMKTKLRNLRDWSRIHGHY